MCGRFSSPDLDKKTLKIRFDIDKVLFTAKQRFNIAPLQQVPAITNINPHELCLSYWGLIPHWSKDATFAAKMINARAESIMEKPSFRKPIQSQRCLILADSFYEWKKTDEGKKPYRIMLKSQELFAFAGIWDIWTNGDRELVTCAIITVQSNSLMQPVHERMPVILRHGKETSWLLENDLNKVLSCLKPYDSDKMKMYEVSTLINSPNNDLAEVIKPFKA